MAPPSSEDSEEETQRRRAIILFVLLFVLVAVGGYFAAASPTEPVPTDLIEATGDLTVTVESQRGASVSGKEVSVVNPDTGEVVASGTTDADGEVTFRNLEQAKYTVRVGGKATDVTLNSNEESVTVGVTVTPPKSIRSAPPVANSVFVWWRAVRPVPFCNHPLKCRANPVVGFSVFDMV